MSRTIMDVTDVIEGRCDGCGDDRLVARFMLYGSATTICVACLGAAKQAIEVIAYRANPAVYDAPEPPK